MKIKLLRIYFSVINGPEMIGESIVNAKPYKLENKTGVKATVHIMTLTGLLDITYHSTDPGMLKKLRYDTPHMMIYQIFE